MRFVRMERWRARAALAWALLLPGCGTVGTQLIGNSRGAYNEVIKRTDDEQLLAMIVRTRYGDSAGLLAVTSVTANVHVAGSVGAEVGVGPDPSFEGNLVPFSAGAVYEVNPTISYVPLQGERFVRQLLSPLPVELLVLLARALRGSELVLGLFVEQVNALRNPLHGGPHAEFERAVALIGALEREGSAVWWVDPEAPAHAQLVLSSRGPEQHAQVRELAETLGFRVPVSANAELVLPVRLAVGAPAEPRLDVQTRSLFDVLEIAASRVEVPEQHLREGVTDSRFAEISAPADFLRIRSAEDRPESAAVAVYHRGVWFYIEDSDPSSKFGFRMLVSLLAMRLSEATAGTAPTLTIPASR